MGCRADAETHALRAQLRSPTTFHSTLIITANRPQIHHRSMEALQWPVHQAGVILGAQQHKPSPRRYPRITLESKLPHRGLQLMLPCSSLALRDMSLDPKSSCWALRDMSPTSKSSVLTVGCNGSFLPIGRVRIILLPGYSCRCSPTA